MAIQNNDVFWQNHPADPEDDDDDVIREELVQNAATIVLIVWAAILIICGCSCCFCFLCCNASADLFRFGGRAILFGVIFFGCWHYVEEGETFWGLQTVAPWVLPVAVALSIVFVVRSIQDLSRPPPSPFSNQTTTTVVLNSAAPSYSPITASVVATELTPLQLSAPGYSNPHTTTDFPQAVSALTRPASFQENGDRRKIDAATSAESSRWPYPSAPPAEGENGRYSNKGAYGGVGDA